MTEEWRGVKWEYYISGVSDGVVSCTDLNAMGQEGWELVQQVINEYGGPHVSLIFKRPIEAISARERALMNMMMSAQRAVDDNG